MHRQVWRWFMWSFHSRCKERWTALETVITKANIRPDVFISVGSVKRQIQKVSDSRKKQVGSYHTSIYRL